MAFMDWLVTVSSFDSVLSSGNRDTYLILASRFLRMFAYGGAALILAVFLFTAGNTWKQIGPFMTISLLGDAVISYLLTVKADRIGRRKVLMIGAVMMIFSGTVFALTKNYYLLLFAAIVGVITPGAHEVGPFRAVQESTLAQLTPIEDRTGMYAWFAATSTLGMAIGLFCGGLLTSAVRLHLDAEWDDHESYQAVFAMYAVVGLLKVILTCFLTERCEPNYKSPIVDDGERETRSPLLSSTGRGLSYTKTAEVTSRIRTLGSSVTTKLNPESKKIVLKLGFLFAVNAFASGMIPVTIMSWYVRYWARGYLMRHIGYMMSMVWLVSSVANLFSAAVARRLGLIRAMVFTHLPNALFLAIIPFAPSWTAFMVFLLISSALGSMDQAPRMAFVAAVFPAEERTAVMGILNLVRTVASAGGPLLSGILFESKMYKTVFLTCAGLKVAYDIGLLAMFLKTSLPEQDGRPRGTTVADVDVGILLSENLTRPEDFETVDDDYSEQDIGVPHGKVTYTEIEDA